MFCPPARVSSSFVVGARVANVLVVNVLVAAVLSTTLHAQNARTTPPGFLSTEGAGYSDMMGALAEGRYMILDGELRGIPIQIKEVAFRADHHMYSGSDATARSWSNVVMKAADCVLARSEYYFAKIPTSTPTLVYSGSVAWPAISGTPAAKPAAWQYRLPFQNTYAHSGKQDLLLDWSFSGGVLANSAPWGYQINTYRLDSSHATWPVTRGLARSYGIAGQGTGCLDAMQTHGGITSILSSTYGPQAYKPFRDTIHLTVTSFDTKPDSLVVQAVGFAGGIGVTFPGITCNKLWVDLTKPTFFHLTTAQNARAFGYLHFTPPFQPLAVGLEVFAQSAWNESKTGSLKLTSAGSVKITGLPPRLPQREAIWSTAPWHATGIGPKNAFPLLPVIRLSY